MLLRLWQWLVQRHSERTALEQELARRIDYLETELHRERERYSNLVERIAFPPAMPIQPPMSETTLAVPENAIRAEARRLSKLSKQRLDAQIQEMESRAASISERDAELSHRANEAVNG